jgi:murein DD-endopeptidase MepM/ murein hydrolase activator NlpD
LEFDKNTMFVSLTRFSRIVTFILVAGFLSSCSSPLKYTERNKSGSTSSSKPIKTVTGNPCRSPYIVKSGDTLSEIAYHCKVDMKAVARLNHLLPPYIIYLKQELVLPLSAGSEEPVKQVKKSPKIKQETSKGEVLKAGKKTVNPQPIKIVQVKSKPKDVTAKAISRPAANKATSRSKKVKSKAWVWPMHKGLAYKYRRDNAGLSILEVYGVPGQKVRAVAPGKVVYAGNGIINYGWMLVIKHANDYMSIYAHNSALLVNKGDEVKAGQDIATLGATGNTKRPKLYLEARYQGRKIDIKKMLKR